MPTSFGEKINEPKILHLNIHGEPATIIVCDPYLFDELSIELSHFRIDTAMQEEQGMSIYFQEYRGTFFSKKERIKIRSLKKIRLTCEIENYSDVANLSTYLFARKGWNLHEAVILILSQLGYLLRLKLTLKYELAVFHGASLSYGGQGIIFVGESGAGKTSLSYLCTKQGFRYLSDEDSFVVFEPNRKIFSLLGFQRRMRINENAVSGFSAFQKLRGQFSGFGEDGIVYDPRINDPDAYCLRAPLKKIIILYNNVKNEKLTFQKVPAEHRFSQLLKYFESATTEYGNCREKIARYNRQGFGLISHLSQSFEVYSLNYFYQKHFFALPFKIKAALSSSEIGNALVSSPAVPRYDVAGIQPPSHREHREEIKTNSWLCSPKKF